MGSIQNFGEAVAKVETLLQKCNEQDDELVSYIRQLALENEQLKRSLHKLRTSKAGNGQAASSMHSKLTDALRE